MSPSPEQRGISRRRFIAAGAGVAATGVAAGAGFALGQRRQQGQRGEERAHADPTTGVEPFHGTHQAGIATPPPARLLFAAFDLALDRREDLAALLRDWTAMAARLTAGVNRPPGTPRDYDAARRTLTLTPPNEGSGAARDLDPGRLTLTFGLGPGVFTRTSLGLDHARPAALIDLPPFTTDALDAARSGGDLCVQACAADAQVLHEAVRTLARIGGARVRLRYAQEGFRAGPSTTSGGAAQTPRNLLGFRDGTANPLPGDPLFEENVWVQDGDAPEWMRGGSYLVVRRIRMFVERWDSTPLEEQERAIGRTKDAGAPLGASHEADPIDLSLRFQGPERVERVLPDGAHVRLANQDAAGIHLLRRSYSFSDGVERDTGLLDVGLFFLAYQRDPRRQFVPMQSNLSHSDHLNTFTSHVGSALFAMFPGVQPDRFLGDRLFAAI